MVAGLIKWSCKSSLRVKCYHAIRVDEEVQTLRERVKFVHTLPISLILIMLKYKMTSLHFNDRSVKFLN